MDFVIEGFSYQPTIQRLHPTVKGLEEYRVRLPNRPRRKKREVRHHRSQTGTNSSSFLRASRTWGSVSGFKTFSRKPSKASAESRVTPLSSFSSIFRLRMASITSDVFERPVESASDSKTELSKSLIRRFNVAIVNLYRKLRYISILSSYGSSASPQHRSTTLDPLQENPFSLLQATSELHLPADQISSHQHDQRRPPGGFRTGQKAAAHNAPRPLPFGGSRSARRRPGKTYASTPLGGRITSEGFVRSASGSGAIVARSPYFLRSSSIGPNSIARCGQDSTQIGCRP